MHTILFCTHILFIFSDAHDHGFDSATDIPVTKGPRYELLEADYANLYLKQK